jgi:hypothetical protein
MEEILNLISLSSTDLQIDDYKKIKEICDDKIFEKKLSENIEFMKYVQKSDKVIESSRILLDFREFLNNRYRNINYLFNAFINFDFDNIKDKKKFNNFCETIKCFDLSGICMNFNDENKKKYIENILSANSNLYVTLNVSYNHIGETGMEILYPILVKEENLREINLTNCHLTDNCISKLEELIKNNTNIKKIIVQNNNITKKISKYPNVFVF